MKIIINVSNLYYGGGVQVAISLLNELRFIEANNEYNISLSKPIDQQIDKKLFSKKFRFYIIPKSDSYFKTSIETIKKLDKLEHQLSPDIVITLFGPSYWKPKVKNLMGFADPWILNKNSVAYKELNFFQRIEKRLMNFYKVYCLKREANYYVIETDNAKIKLLNLLKTKDDQVYVISNCYNHVFNNKELLNYDSKDFIKLPKKELDEFRLVLISHNYSHKNLKIIQKIIPLIKSYNVKFVLTIDHKNYDELFYGMDNHVINLGPIQIKSAPSIYSQCDALFLPTLLEVFSASYLEAMIMQIPILTSNYSFAEDICKDAALYFDPLNPIDISEKIIELKNIKKLQKLLKENGNKRIQNFETASSRAKKYLKICNMLVNM